MIKVQESMSHIGLFSHGNIYGALVFSKNPLRKTRLFLMRLGRFKVEVYNYSPMVSFRKTNGMYGLHVLFLRLTWFR